MGSQTQVKKPRIQPFAGLEGSSVVTQLDPPYAGRANWGLRVLTGFPGFPLFKISLSPSLGLKPPSHHFLTAFSALPAPSTCS